MSNWEIGYVLPSLKFEEPFESSFIAIVPYDDDRIKRLCTTNTSANKLVNCFLDNHNQKIEPAILIFDTESPQSVKTNEAVVSFRNIVALSIMFSGWSRKPAGFLQARYSRILLTFIPSR